MVANLSNAEQIEQIKKSMERIRCELDTDFQEVRRSASRLTDWQHYVRRYPWITIGAASLLGCLVVPRKRNQPAHLDADSLQRIISSIGSARRERPTSKDEQEEEVEEAENNGFTKAMMTFAVGSIMRAATNHLVNKYLSDTGSSSIWKSHGTAPTSGSTGASVHADSTYVDDHAV